MLSCASLLTSFWAFKKELEEQRLITERKRINHRRWYQKHKKAVDRPKEKQ